MTQFALSEILKVKHWTTTLLSPSARCIKKVKWTSALQSHGGFPDVAASWINRELEYGKMRHLNLEKRDLAALDIAGNSDKC